MDTHCRSSLKNYRCVKNSEHNTSPNHPGWVGDGKIRAAVSHRVTLWLWLLAWPGLALLVLPLFLVGPLLGCGSLEQRPRRGDGPWCLVSWSLPSLGTTAKCQAAQGEPAPPCPSQPLLQGTFLLLGPPRITKFQSQPEAGPRCPELRIRGLHTCLFHVSTLFLLKPWRPQC